MKYALLAIILFAIAISANSAFAVANITNCITIDTPGEYDINVSNITDNAFGSGCINITTSNVTLNGSGFTIDGTRKSGSYGVYVYNSTTTLSNVTVKNLIITDWNHGIYIKSSSNNTLTNNTANSNTDAGIYITSSSNNTLTNNTANSNSQRGISLTSSSNSNTLANNTAYNNTQYGIYLYLSDNNILTNNTAYNNPAYGIYVDFSDNNTLINNTANSSGRGIFIDESHSNTLTSNSMNGNTWSFILGSTQDSYFNNSVDTSNTVDGKPIYYIKNAANAVYDSSTNASTFYCILCNNVTVRDLNLTKGYQGVFFHKTNNSTIENVTVSSNSYGIYLSSSNNNTFYNNTANSNSGSGIYITSSSSNTLTNNNASSNNASSFSDGIHLSSSNNNTFYNNTANSNPRYGIYLSSSNNNTFYNNTANSNTYNGISLSSSSNNTLTNNTAYNNSAYGIYLSASKDNTLTNNIDSNNRQWDFYSDSTSLNNIVYNLALLTATISFKGGNGFAINATTNPPAATNNISKYFNATNTSTTSWLYINVSYTESELGGRNFEDTLKLYRHNGTAWNVIPLTGVNRTQKFVWGNITEFSIFAPLGNPTLADILEGSKYASGTGGACAENIFPENQSSIIFSIEQNCGAKIIFSKNESYNLVAKEIIGSLVNFEISGNSRKIITSAALLLPSYVDLNNDRVNDLKISVNASSAGIIKVEITKLRAAKNEQKVSAPAPIEFEEEKAPVKKETSQTQKTIPSQVVQNAPWLMLAIFAVLIIVWLVAEASILRKK